MRHAGIGLRQPHYGQLLQERPALAFVELHSENFFAAGGAAPAVLRRVREHYPVSLHGVGLGLGSATGLDAQHLQHLRRLVQALEPLRVSDHASFARGHVSEAGAVHANDLLPVAFTQASLELMCSNVQQVQECLGRPILVENICAYLQWQVEQMSEAEFLNQLAQATGCQLLLDVNNLVVNALNQGLRGEAAVAQACAGISAIEPAHVGQLHLAGYHLPHAPGALVIDDHGSPVHPPVWQAYAHALRHLGPRPVLVEWDTQVPALSVLLAEAAKAEAMCLHDLRA